ncbi:hypothetical protein STRCI_008451 [Streptomyces cinnabarinus]|uniref:Peptidase S1 domain-containing protein n=1 Tax=Streptomyces cinnabarinus TaxID=67287 RepID=A0ABY7KQG8_9ACTN|nr:hypothetical protein [Streptomyces cinnabarinus]WAZ26806.1 hypothetical protein STRCI_008451 [Streptomyces cinnabarinus]
MDDPTVSQAVPVFGPYSGANPNRFIGKVFFTLPNGQDSKCSGSVVNASNRSMVSTAAHCLYPDGRSGGAVRNFAFVPAAYAGTTPLGVWTPRNLFVPRRWAEEPHITQFDFGAAIMTRDPAGRGIQDVLGAFYVQRNLGDAFVDAIGYPEEGRFNGQPIMQWYCAGYSKMLDSRTERSLKCDFLPGASGGPWYRTVRPFPTLPPIWYLRGQTSTYGAGTTYSPYFGDGVFSFYQQAGSR